MNTNINYFWGEQTDDGILIYYWFNHNSQKLVVVTIDTDVNRLEVRTNKAAVQMWAQYINSVDAEAYVKISREDFMAAVNTVGSQLADSYLMLKSHSFFNT